MRCRTLIYPRRWTKVSRQGPIRENRRNSTLAANINIPRRVCFPPKGRKSERERGRGNIGASYSISSSSIDSLLSFQCIVLDGFLSFRFSCSQATFSPQFFKNDRFFFSRFFQNFVNNSIRQSFPSSCIFPSRITQTRRQ